MKFAFPICCALGLTLAGCGAFIGVGPDEDEVVAQQADKHEILFDVVKVDDRVLETVLARARPRFATLFKGAPAPELRIAVGDTVSVVIWEAGPGGLFTEAVPQFPAAGPGEETEPLAPEPGETPPGQPAAPNPLEPPTLPGVPGQQGPPSAGAPAPGGEATAPPVPSELGQALQGAAAESAREGVAIPPQVVGFDGGISIPFAGRVPAAGHTPAEVQQIIEQRLANKALQPQALVLISNSAQNAATVTGEVVAGTRVPLPPGGLRLLQVIAAAGGTRQKLHNVVVRLTRGGVTASIPLRTLVDEPAEDIYAEPGDVVTLVRVPKTLSVFGATTLNRTVTFDDPQFTLTEGLARARGLQDQRAAPSGVFLFRYEPFSLVRALGQPIATRAEDGASPIVYRFDLYDPKAYLLAQRFPLHDKDIVFVADAKGRRLYKFVRAFAEIVGPVETGLLVCFEAKC